MPPLVPRSYLEARQSSGTAPTPAAYRTVFVLCIVFGSLLALVLTAIAIYFARYYVRKRRLLKIQNLHRDASFLAGASPFRVSGTPLTTPAPAQAKRTRRPGRSRQASSIYRPAIPSPELGSVFRLDSTLVRAAPPKSSNSPPTPGRPSTNRASSARYQSLFSNGSTLVGSSIPPTDKYDMPLQVISPPPPATPLNTNTITTQPPRPNHTKYSPSRERLVASSASADSLTSTPSPEATSHSRQGTFAPHKSQQSVSSLASLRGEPPTGLAGLECTPFILPAVREAAPSPPPLGRHHSADEALQGPLAGTPVTLSHFPFRFSHTGAAISPGLSSFPKPPSHLGVRQNSATARLANAQRPDVERGAWTLPHSRSSLKLKIKHAASDQIIAVAFTPHALNFVGIRDAVHAKLGFQPRRIWDDNDNRVISDDTTLRSWVDEQYTKGQTRLILQVE